MKRLKIGQRVMGLIGLMGLMACSSGGDTLLQEPAVANGDGNGNGDGPQVQQPIGFSGIFADSEGGRASSRRAVTRAVGDGEFGLDNELLQQKGFGVYCWYTGTNSYTENTDIKPITREILMLNQKVEWKKWDGVNDTWNYTPSKYWPLIATEKLTFRAYAPYVSYQLQTDATTGLPLLPVVVTKDDYHNGTQHDPLWGTGRLVDPSTGEYYPEPDPEDVDQSKSKRYGQHYDNITYEMSGDHRLKETVPADTRNGIIDWYFHHGMSKLVFKVSVIQNPGCDKVTIRSVKIEGLYTQGLLNLSSPTKAYDEKPIWTQCDGNMTVTLDGATTDDGGSTWTAGDLAPIPDPEHPENPHPTKPYPFIIETKTDAATDYISLLSSGLLIIPRDFRSEALKVTITYTVDDDDENNALEAQGNIEQQFEGNTAYTLKMNLTPSTKGLEITLVQSAFTPWHDAGTGNHTVYNW